MASIADKKGFLFSVSAILLLIPLIMLISSYEGLSTKKIGEAIEKTQCDKLHYFAEDIGTDLKRATSIIGRRAANSAKDDVVMTGNNLRDYIFQCSNECVFNCSDFHFYGNGSEAAIAEIALCGTLHGTNIPGMTNHTFPIWIDRIKNGSRAMQFILDLDIIDLRVIPYDAWSFAIITDMRVTAYDREKTCFYDEVITIISNASIIDIEDPLYPLNAGMAVSKRIKECDPPFNYGVVIGNGTRGSGIGGGKVILRSNITDLQATTFCTTNNVDGVLLVLDEKYDKCDDFELICFNRSSPKSNHFKGVINYGNVVSNQFEGVGGCNITIPWVANTSNLPLAGDDCASIRNRCPDFHQVIAGSLSDVLTTECYQVSDMEKYNLKCAGGHPTGPCFFDRLDGNLQLSQKYLKQANETFNTTKIGIESLLSLDTLVDTYGITVDRNATWVAYLYWQNITGCDVCPYCKSTVYNFKLDCPHAHKFRLDTCCDNIECPAYLQTRNCKLCSGTNCSVTYTVMAKNCSMSPITLSSIPEIFVEVDGIVNSYIMEPILGSTGNYSYITAVFDDSSLINSTTVTTDPGCPVITNSTEIDQIKNITDC